MGLYSAGRVGGIGLAAAIGSTVGARMFCPQCEEHTSLSIVAASGLFSLLFASGIGERSHRYAAGLLTTGMIGFMAQVYDQNVSMHVRTHVESPFSPLMFAASTLASIAIQVLIFEIGADRRWNGARGGCEMAVAEESTELPMSLFIPRMNGFSLPPPTVKVIKKQEKASLDFFKHKFLIGVGTGFAISAISLYAFQSLSNFCSCSATNTSFDHPSDDCRNVLDDLSVLELVIARGNIFLNTTNAISQCRLVSEFVLNKFDDLAKPLASSSTISYVSAPMIGIPVVTSLSYMGVKLTTYLISKIFASAHLFWESKMNWNNRQVHIQAVPIPVVPIQAVPV